jgi:hypothetical protein
VALIQNTFRKEGKVQKLIMSTESTAKKFTKEDQGGIYIDGKAIPLQALTGPEGSRRLRLPDFKTIGV